MQKNYFSKTPLLGLILVLSLTLGAQTTIDLRTQTKNVDFSTASATKPFKTGSTLPIVCTVGEVFFNTAAQPGENLYACVAADTWKLQSGGGGSAAANFQATFSNQTTVSLTHNRNTTAIGAACFDNTGAEIGYDRLTILNSNSAEIRFAVAQSGTCVVIGGSGAASSGGGSGGGEVITASNTGTAGTGVFLAKTGSNLEFKKLNAGSGRLSVTDDTANGKIDFDVVQSALSLAGLGGQLSATQIATASKQGNGTKLAMFAGTGPVSGNCAKWDASGNVSDAGAPCGSGSGSSLPTQTGQSGKFLFTDGTSASWGAIDKIQGRTVADINPSSGQTLVWNSIAARWEPGTISSAGALLAGPGVVVSGGNTVGVDTATVPMYLTASLSSFDFGSIAPQSCSETDLPLPGALTLDAVAAGWPQFLEAGLVGTMFVSQANMVRIRLCNITGSSINPAEANFRASVIRSF